MTATLADLFPHLRPPPPVAAPRRYAVELRYLSHWVALPGETGHATRAAAAARAGELRAECPGAELRVRVVEDER